MWRNMVNEQFSRGMWEYFTLKAEVKKILENASRERHEGIQGQWQQESPFREVLEQVRGNVDLGCGAQMVRTGSIAMRDGSWEEFKEGCRNARSGTRNGRELAGNVGRSRAAPLCRGSPLLLHRQFINSCLSRSVYFFATCPVQFCNFLAIFCLMFSKGRLRNQKTIEKTKV